MSGKQRGKEENDYTGWRLSAHQINPALVLCHGHSHMQYFQGIPCPLVSGSTTGEPLRTLEVRRPEYLFPRLDQADCPLAEGHQSLKAANPTRVSHSWF